MDPKSPTGLPDASTPAREPSGIMAVKTRFQKKRPGRKLSRPTTRSLLVLFVLVLVGAIGATIHRRVLESEFETRVARSQATPYEIKRIRQELADLEVDQKTLAGALDARLKRVEAAKRNEFYVSIDTKRKTFSFRFADKTLRDAPVEVGPPQTIVAGKKKWTFAPLSGSFNVAGKYQDQGWRVPEWAYLRNDAKPPANAADGQERPRQVRHPSRERLRHPLAAFARVSAEGGEARLVHGSRRGPRRDLAARRSGNAGLRLLRRSGGVS